MELAGERARLRRHPGALRRLPFYPDGNVLWDLARDEEVALFGTSAKYLDALHKQGYAPSRLTSCRSCG